MANIKITELQPIPSTVDHELDKVVGGRVVPFFPFPHHPVPGCHYPWFPRIFS